MSKLKKILVVLLALTLVLSFAACKKDDKEDEKDVFVKVTFDTNGGSSVIPVSVKKGTPVPKPADPTKPSTEDATFKFVKWTLDGNDYDFSKFVESDITLKAVWDCIPVDKPVQYHVTSLKYQDGGNWILEKNDHQPVITIEPKEYASEVTYTSDDEEIASVLEDGTIKALKPGKTKVTAKAGELSTSIEIEVKAIASGIKLDTTECELDYGNHGNDSKQFKVTFEPENAMEVGVTFTSSSPEVVSIDGNGFMKALLPGNATITAMDAYGHKATCQVYVNGMYVELIGFYELSDTEYAHKVSVLEYGKSYRYLAMRTKFAHGLSGVAGVTGDTTLFSNGYFEGSNGIVNWAHKPANPMTVKVSVRWDEYNMHSKDISIQIK